MLFAKGIFAFFVKSFVVFLLFRRSFDTYRSDEDSNTIIDFLHSLQSASAPIRLRSWQVAQSNRFEMTPNLKGSKLKSLLKTTIWHSAQRIPRYP